MHRFLFLVDSGTILYYFYLFFNIFICEINKKQGNFPYPTKRQATSRLLSVYSRELFSCATRYNQVKGSKPNHPVKIDNGKTNVILYIYVKM